MRITDPRRMLNGFTFDPYVPALRCFVIGCYDGAVIGRRHKLFGAVDTCPGHDPDRHGYGLPFGSEGAPTDGAPVQDVPPVIGGTRVPVPVTPINRPPSGQKVQINF